MTYTCCDKPRVFFCMSIQVAIRTVFDFLHFMLANFDQRFGNTCQLWGQWIENYAVMQNPLDVWKKRIVLDCIYNFYILLCFCIVMFKVSHKKSYFRGVEFPNFQILLNFDFDFFFQCTKLRQPTGKRQLLENKQILCNIWKFNKYWTALLLLSIGYMREK